MSSAVLDDPAVSSASDLQLPVIPHGERKFVVLLMGLDRFQQGDVIRLDQLYPVLKKEKISRSHQRTIDENVERLLRLLPTPAMREATEFESSQEHVTLASPGKPNPAYEQKIAELQLELQRIAQEKSALSHQVQAFKMGSPSLPSISSVVPVAPLDLIHEKDMRFQKLEIIHQESVTENAKLSAKLKQMEEMLAALQPPSPKASAPPANRGR